MSQILEIFLNSKYIWVKVFKNRPSKIYGRQPLKNFTWSILEYLDHFEYFDSKIND